MLLPQRIVGTDNIYHATIALLAIMCGEGNTKDMEIVVPMMKYNYGDLSVDDFLSQVCRAMGKDPSKPAVGGQYLSEPNLEQQPMLYENRSWIDIVPELMKREFIIGP